jgi:hypothetical protein
MTSSLDLNLLPIARQGGQDLPELPDLYAVLPPRRSAHGREADSLVLYLSLTGNAPLSPEQHTHLLERLAQKYYKTSGSVTAALRAVAEALNLYLLDRNLRSTGGGRQGIGLLVLGVLRADTFYMAHCGPVQAFLINPRETRPLHEQSSAGRGLGLSRTTPVRYVQARLADGDFLLLASKPSAGWTESVLRHPQRQGIDGMRRQLVDYAVADVNSVLIHAQVGTGRLRFLHRKPGAPGMAQAASEVQELRDIEASSPPAAKPGLESAQSTPRQLMPASERAAPPQAALPRPAQPVPPALASSVRRAGMQQPLGGPPAAATPEATPVPRLERRPRRAQGSLTGDLRAAASKIGQGIRRASSAALTALSRALKNVLPDEGTFKLPPGVMIFFALAVPLVLAIAGGMAFIKRGQSQQYQAYYQEAVLLASQAAPQTDPALQREGWNRVLEQLDKAEYYASTADSQALRVQAVAVLDGLDGVQRLDFQPAIIGGLDDSARIARMVASDSYLFMLNAHQGAVMLAVQIPQGYQINSNFQCGPTYGPITVGPLVDIVELPQGAVEDAVLLGMDTAGNLVYCTLTGQPLAKSLAQPSTGLGEPIALAIDDGDLFVLDPKVNAVWVYDDMDVGALPHFFFGNDVPPMQDVIDLAVYDDKLYLLHSDGHLTQCSYSYLAEAPTTCKEPFAFTDNRPGRVSGTVIPDSLFNQVSYVSFPDRSMYMLDPHNQAVFFFSVLFNFQTQYRAIQDLADGQATAFAISTNRMIYLAIGNAVYYAALP